jgi:hypothetical protein
VAVQLKLTGMALPATPVGSVEVWVGSGCNSYTTRTTANQTQCEKLPSTLTFSDFTVNSNVGADGILVPIEAKKLFDPVNNMCTMATANNAVWIIVTLADNNNPAYCTLALTETNVGPPPAQSVSASSGDSAVTVNWAPPSGATSIDSFQVLCADANGNPIPGQRDANTNQQAYSSCVDGVLTRRVIPTASSTTATTTNDGGVITTTDGGTAAMSVPLEPASDRLGTEAVDGGTDDAGTTVGTGFPGSLDPAFICSPQIMATLTSYSRRITGLTNGVGYQFSVLAIDKFGNAVPSDLVIGSPQPTEDLYRRFRDQGGGASGFCFIATAAYGSYENRWVMVLRDFRDEILLTTSLGQRFVDWYYAHSPPWADYIAEHRAARILTQMLLWPVIGVAALIVYLPLWPKVLLLALVLGWLLRKRIGFHARQA